MPDLSKAGSSSYSSNTLHVGDGTWDKGRDTFLLPNLQGVNFDTMRYNGMGNRFKELPEYHRLIVGHGVLAAITFLFIIPLAIGLAKYGFFDRRLSMKLHVYLQVLAVFLSTVILILGWMAVGPARSLTNPHHGIGVAIYTLLMVQFLYGWLMARAERRRKNPMALTRTPLKVWLHKLLGRGTAILGFVQIPLGLTLYGSPKVLFILFGVYGAFLIFVYLALDRYYFEKRPVDFGLHGGRGHGEPTEYYSDYGSYLSGTRTDFTQDHGRPNQQKDNHWGRKILAGAGALGAYEAWKHKRNSKKDDNQMDDERRHSYRPPSAGPYGPPPGPNAPYPPPGPYDGPPPGPYGPSQGPYRRNGSRPPSQRPQSGMSTESWEDEKYNTPPKHTWRNRILGAGAGIAAFEGVKSMFGRKKRDDGYVESGNYRPPLGGNQSFMSQTDLSRVHNGQAPFSPGTPGGRVGGGQLNAGGPGTPSRPSRHNNRPSADSLSYADEDSYGGRPLTPPDEESHTLRNSIATFGAIAGFKEWNKHRKNRNERQRMDQIRRQELDHEDQYNRRNSNNYPRPGDAPGRRPSMDDTVMTGATTTQDDFSRHHAEPFNPGHSSAGLDTSQPPLPAAAGAFSSGSNAPMSGISPGMGNQQNVNMQQQQQAYSLPPPPPGPAPNMGMPQQLPYAAPGPTMAQQLPYANQDSDALQMPSHPQPDPSRLANPDQSGGHPGMDTAAAGLAGAGLGAMAAGGRRHERHESHPPPSTQNSNIHGTAPDSSETGGEPPISVKVKMHNDGRTTLRRLTAEEAAAERAQRRSERKQRRRPSSFSSGGEDNNASPSGTGGRYRRNNNGPPPSMRPSSAQPITDIPPIPPSHSSAGRRASELNLPPPIPGGMMSSHTSGGGGGMGSGTPPRVPQHGDGSSQNLSPYGGPGVGGSGMSGGDGVASPGTGTDVSAFADNRRRRRAERARRLEAARGGQRVEFE